MKALKPLAASLAAALSLASPDPTGAAPPGGHASASGFHGSSGFHAPSGSFQAAPRAFSIPHSSTVRTSPGNIKAPTFAFGGHAAAPADPPATTARSSNSGSARPTSGWNRHWDRVWHGRHYHWNNGAWVIINDGYYPWDDSYYFPASSDVYPDMSYDYGDTPSDAGAPNPAPNALAANPFPRPDNIATDVQQSLASRGYYDGEIDGIVGDATREAIADFQKDSNLPTTGYITKSLLNALGL
jgi:hypothetical protein